MTSTPTSASAIQKSAAKTKRPKDAHAPGPSAAAAIDEQLARYRAMRDFSTTAEPSGETAQNPAQKPASNPPTNLPFVIQKHAATRLHYDFRLGWRGVLKSWAVAKGPSYVVRDKRLAVQVEDHPMEYGGFEGTIPKGQYGGGTVLLWDQGTWEPQPGHTDIDEGLRNGSLKIILRGEKLHGKWALIRMGGKSWGSKDDSKANWLLIKEHDEYEQAAATAGITDTAPDSVVTGRSLEQIAAAEDHVWHSNRPDGKNEKDRKDETSGKGSEKSKVPANHSRLARTASRGKVPAERAANLSGAPEEAYPGFLAPQLATPAQRAPASGDWLHELKLDGYRVQAHIDRLPSGPRVTLFTRNGLDWTHRMAAVAEAVSTLPVDRAILDGEVVVLDDQGGSSFSRLQAAFDEGAPNPLTYFVFDLLHLDGKNLRGLPLRERKKLLQNLLAERIQPAPALLYGEHVEATAEQSAAEIFSSACSAGAEGIIAKQADARYTAGRSDKWLKLKCVRRQEFVVGGFTLPKDRGQGLGSLLLGYYKDGKLVHCGRTGTGFTQASARMVRAKVEPLRTPRQPYSGKLSHLARKDAIWVEPGLVCEVEFATWTADGAVRHASFQGLREDKAAGEVTREESGPAMKGSRGKGLVGPEEPSAAKTGVESAAPEKLTAQPTPDSLPTLNKKAKRASTANEQQPLAKATSTALSPPATQALPRLTHPEKILDAASGLTKEQLAFYLQAIAPAMLPHIADRPSSLVRCPDGSIKPCFFQKHAGVGLPKSLGSVEVRDKKTGKIEPYITVDSAEGLISLAQLSVLEIHPWGSRNESLERPDRLIFDLDPDEALPWPTLVASARSIRDFLRDLKLESFVKTTGGKGLHIVVPIAPTVDWPQIKLFCRGVAAAIESSDPKLYLIKMTKAARTGRIFVDYLRNERGATAVAPYSPRARAGMRVAVPLDWQELDSGMPAYSVANFESWRDRLKHDPWASMASSKQTIQPEVLAAVLEAGANA